MASEALNLGLCKFRKAKRTYSCACFQSRLGLVMGRQIEIIAIYRRYRYRVGVFNIGFSICRIVSVTNENRLFIDNFAYLFCFIKQFRLVCGSILDKSQPNNMNNKNVDF